MGEKQQKSIPRDRKRKGELDPAADYVKDLWDAFYVTAESTHVQVETTKYMLLKSIFV
jgi:hypothetical protein